MRSYERQGGRVKSLSGLDDMAEVDGRVHVNCFNDPSILVSESLNLILLKLIKELNLKNAIYLWW